MVLDLLKAAGRGLGLVLIALILTGALVVILQMCHVPLARWMVFPLWAVALTVSWGIMKKAG
jgi:hypothetical protein